MNDGDIEVSEYFFDERKELVANAVFGVVSYGEEVR